ncbi:MAG: hypothetical protein D6800_11740 [Candidatus Zixiibacteriota bacterium]|nr:MAG: hypothetical protein D6800_11740 [candidate division Zixibacteria bacterium]
MPFDIIYTNIGRGHPFYLDGILQALNHAGAIRLVRRQADVFELSHGLARLAWRTVRRLYHLGGAGGVGGKVYSALRGRNQYRQDSFALRLLGRDVKRTYADDRVPLLVAHPSLVGLLQSHGRVLYQHGELVAPAEAAVPGAETVFVPTEETAEVFHRAGYSVAQVLVTGLCVEPVLVRRAEDMFNHRMRRLQSEQPLTGAFFSSGAEPKKHLELILRAVASVLNSGGRAIIFARKDGSLHRKVSRHLSRSLASGVVGDIHTPLPLDVPPLMLILFANRREEDALTVQLFDRFDYYVGPSHERTNWGVGLGLPMFITTPCIGPFAPLNLQLIANQGVGLAMDAQLATLFGREIKSLKRQGTLADMARAGFGRYPIDGFKTIADFLIEHFS